MDNKKTEEQIDDLVSMIDQFMAGNGGHMNVHTNHASNTDNFDTISNDTIQKATQTTNCLDCASGDMACKIPTLHEGLDGAE